VHRLKRRNVPEASEAATGWDLPETGAAGCNLLSLDSIRQNHNYVYGCNSRQCLKRLLSTIENIEELERKIAQLTVQFNKEKPLKLTDIYLIMRKW